MVKGKTGIEYRRTARGLVLKRSDVDAAGLSYHNGLLVFSTVQGARGAYSLVISTQLGRAMLRLWRNGQFTLRA